MTKKYAYLPCTDMRAIRVMCDRILDAVTKFDFRLSNENIANGDGRDIRAIIAVCDRILYAVAQLDFRLGYEFTPHSPIIRELKRVEEHLDEKEDLPKAKIYRAFIEYIEVLKEEAQEE